MAATNQPMVKLNELTELDRKLGDLSREVRAVDSDDWEKVSQIRAKISLLQTRKNDFLGIAE